MTLRFAFVAATIIAMALTRFEPCPSASAQAAIHPHQKVGATPTGRSRYARPVVPFEAFGALASAIARIAAAERQRESYGPYYSPYSAPYPYSRSPSARPPAYQSGPRQPPPLVTREAAGRL
jgi:hypothetical protein